MIDGYTKGVLTVIAAALAILAVGQFVQKAGAQFGGCGADIRMPCYVATAPGRALEIKTGMATPSPTTTADRSVHRMVTAPRLLSGREKINPSV